MIKVHVSVNYDNPPPPLRIISGGKTRYFLSLTQNEKCAFYFNYLSMHQAEQARHSYIDVLTSEKYAENFYVFRAIKFSHIPVNQRLPYHEVVSSLWQKVHELIMTYYDDLDQAIGKADLLPNYMMECADTLKRHEASEARKSQSIVFNQTEYNVLSSLHKHPAGWQPN